MNALLSFFRRHKRLRQPFTAIHHALWRATGWSGVRWFRPELRELQVITARSRTPSPASGPRILLYSFRGWQTHNFPEALLGHALRLRGAEIHHFTCGGRLPVCDITSHILAPPMPCNICAPFLAELAITLGFPHSDTSAYVSASERSSIERQVADLRDEELETYHAEGLPIGQLVRPSLQWFLLTGSPSSDRFSRDIYRRFLISASIEALAAGKLFDTVRPDQVLLLNGAFFAERVAIEQARRRNIPFITHEAGFMPNTHVYLRNALAPYHDLGEFWPRYAERPLSTRENELLDSFLLQRSAGTTDTTRYYPTIEADAARITRELSLDPDKTIVSVFTNVDWDTAAFATTAAFPNMEEWLVRTLDHFSSQPEIQVVVRVHPAEVRLPMYLAPRQPVFDMLARRIPTLSANVRIVPPDSTISSYTLMELSALGLVYTSTVGMEMSLRGTPVVVGGQAYYGGRGFTRDAHSPDAYFDLIGDALRSGKLPPEQIERARRYAFLFFFRYHIVFRPLDTTWDTVQFKLETLDQLATGQDASLDLLCDAILRGKPLLYEGDF